ncbi:MAG: hypothetical protein WBE18_00010 [Gammaproteobacteria bacterium]
MKMHRFVLPLVLASSLLAGCSQPLWSSNTNGSNSDTSMVANATPVNMISSKRIYGVIVSSRFINPAKDQIEYIVHSRKVGGNVSIVQSPPLMPNGTRVMIMNGSNPRMMLSPRDQ